MTMTTPRSRRGLAVLVVSCAASSLLIGAAAQEPSAGAPPVEKKRSILSIIFDGVPAPGTEKARKRPARKAVEPPEADAAAADPGTFDRPRPEIEQLKTWADIQKALPTDIVGG